MVWRWMWNLFHETDRICFYIFTIKKPCLTSEIIITYSTSETLNFLLITFNTCIWFLNMFLSNLRTWRHNSLLFSHRENNTLIFSQCENNSLWWYQFYSMDKTRYLTTENVIKHPIFIERWSICFLKDVFY